MADETQGAPTAPPAPPTVAAPLPPGLPPAPAPSPGAGQTAPLFGGNRGGRPRNDGLVAGSPEAKEADRKANRERMAATRARERAARERAAQPPPLPAAAAVAGQAPAPPGSVGPVPGPEALPGVVAPIPWEPTALKPLFDQLIPTLEELSVSQISTRATKAKLPASLVKEIETDAKWSALAKKGIEHSGPRVTAKWLNKFGVPSGSQDEIILVTAIGTIVAGHTKLLKRLDTLIAAQQSAAATAAAATSKPNTAEKK